MPSSLHRRTTPQLHYVVRCHNDPSYGVPTEEGYYKKLGDAFCALCPKGAEPIKISVDCANGVGAPKFVALAAPLTELLNATIVNDGSTGVLNEGCGADYVKTNQKAPSGMDFGVGELCASFDGDADRLMFFFKTESGAITILDGDRIAILCALFLNEKLAAAKLTEIKLGVVQTA
jgi:phosphoacetylglucosamine mutase